jgi:hypothetical protein
MKGNDVFPSKWLKAEDLGQKTPTVTIKKVDIETIGEDSKPILYFEGKDKGLVLNKTNWNALVDLCGADDSDDWTGHKVKLYVVKVDYQGKRVPAIRIDAAPTNGQQKPKPVAEPVETPDEDAIPFAWLLPLALPLLGVFA